MRRRKIAKTEIRYGGQTATGLSPFLRLVVNDIRKRKSCLTTVGSRLGGATGASFEIRMNLTSFLRLRFYMRPDSPVLWAVLLPGPLA